MSQVRKITRNSFSWFVLVIVCGLARTACAEIEISDHYSYFSIPAPDHCAYSSVAALEAKFTRTPTSIRSGVDWSKSVNLVDLARLVDRSYVNCRVEIARSNLPFDDISDLLKAGFDIIVHSDFDEGHYVFCGLREGGVLIHDNLSSRIGSIADLKEEFIRRKINPSGNLILIASPNSHVWKGVEISGADKSYSSEIGNSKNADLEPDNSSFPDPGYTYTFENPQNNIFSANLVIKKNHDQDRSEKIKSAYGSCSCVKKITVLPPVADDEIGRLEIEVDAAAIPDKGRKFAVAVLFEFASGERADKYVLHLPNDRGLFKGPTWWVRDKQNLYLYFPQSGIINHCMVAQGGILSNFDVETILMSHSGQRYVRWCIKLDGPLNEVSWFTDDTGWVSMNP